jgi:mannose-6-phosphate isomerase-like protein (cupin superfamily)
MKSATVVFVLGIVLTCVSSTRGDPEGFAVWPGVVSHIAETEVPWEELGDYQNHLIATSFIRDDGPAEVHESQIEIWIVQDGNATLVVGGEILEPKTIKPHEIRGLSIKGGSETPLTQGAIVHIPANLPHQLKIAPGKYLIYTTIRMDAR